MEKWEIKVKKRRQPEERREEVKRVVPGGEEREIEGGGRTRRWKLYSAFSFLMTLIDAFDAFSCCCFVDIFRDVSASLSASLSSSPRFVAPHFLSSSQQDIIIGGIV